MSNLNVITLFLQTSLAVQLVVGFLLLLTLVSWFVIFRIARRTNGIQKFDEDFEVWLWGGESLQAQYDMVRNDFDRVGLEQIFYIGYDEFLTAQKITNSHTHVLEVTERKFNIILTKQKILLRQGLSLLTNISIVAPYIGVLGAIWGMVGALSLSENITFDIIIPDIIEALLIIALSLFITISTKWALNYFDAKIESIHDNRILFCEELIGFFSHQHMIAQKTLQNTQNQLPPATSIAQETIAPTPSEPKLISQPAPEPKPEPTTKSEPELTLLDELEEFDEPESALTLELDTIVTPEAHAPQSHNLIK
ncbi:MotA/TolQ/ExbB proton channel family protein [Moraxella oblonga]|uniref:MotA/TolQ/ExbB proton channel family protein n=1 Tax=Moraxella oblonga TaxID=200413 RepID=UPI00083230FE|nr:MotA/TolQ/ExbB proton channel family protein [Moraxella oblonga]